MKIYRYKDNSSSCEDDDDYTKLLFPGYSFASAIDSITSAKMLNASSLPLRQKSNFYYSAI